MPAEIPISVPESGPYAVALSMRTLTQRLLGRRSGTLAVLWMLLLAASWANAQTESVLYSFSANPDGALPGSAPVFDSNGNLYGTTPSAGSGNGAVFKLTPVGVETIIYSFTGGNDGASPYGGLMINNGVLYGTTSSGGAYGNGTVFSMTLSGQITTLYSFHGGADGGDPLCALVMDQQGNLYGTTQDGGSGYGTVFELTPSGNETVLHSFSPNGTDGYFPYGGLVFVNGNLYGTASTGGSSGKGAVFEVTPSGTETVIYSFAGGTDGAGPVAPLVLGSNGILYGTTTEGGSANEGVVFSVTTSGSETVLHTFTGSSADGAYGWGPLVLDAAGNLYGITEQGGAANNGGVVFEVTPSGVESILHNFNPNTGDGYFSQSGLTFYQGSLYGTTQRGGAHNDGTVFVLTGVSSALGFTSANAATFTVGAAGSFTVTTSGSPTPSLSETGPLPSGVTFTDNGNGTASLAGTPASGTAGTYPITITASSSAGSITQSFTLTVDLTVAFTSGNSTTFTIGNAGAFTVSAVGTPTPALSETGSLPSGVTFVDNGNGTATLSGTPASGTTGSYPLSFTASNGVSSATQNFTLSVNEGPAITSGSATSFAVGTAGSFLVTTAGVPVPALTESGSLPNGVTFVDNGNGTATLSGTPSAGSGGTYPITITAANGVGTNATQSFTLTVNQGLAITSGSMTTFTVGSTGFFSVTTTGFPVPSLSETGALPSGITFTDNGNGTATLSGTPAAGSGNTYPISITASNGGVDPNATQSFTLLVNQGAAIVTGNTTTFTVGVQGSFTVTTTGVPVPALTETGTLPGGVTFTDNGNGTATLSGTPVSGAGGSYPLTFTASNGIGTAAMQSFSLVVNQGPAIISINTAAFTEQLAGSFTVTTTGDPTPALSETGSLPSGISFVDNGNGTATLSGTSAAGTAGQYGFTIQASNGVAPNATQTFTLTISVSQSKPVITWPTPAPIYYLEALGATQLNATANVAGTFVYSPPAGTVLAVGTQTLSASFTPTNTTAYATANATVQISVLGNQPHTIGGTVTGLAFPMILLDNGGNALRVERDGSFTFTQVLATGASYNVTVGTPPVGQVCTVANGLGIVGSQNIDNIVVTCTKGITIGGTVTGLAAGQTLVLLDNGGDALTIRNFLDENHLPFTFRTALASGDSFDVTVGTQPLSTICTVARGTGTPSGNGNVTDIAVTCGAGNTIGGTVGGLADPGLTLLDNGGNALRVERDGSFTFTQVLATGASYNVTVGTPPIGQVCTVAKGSGIVTGDVNNVLVTCTHGITIGGTVTGLEAGQTLVLLDNGGDALTIRNPLHESQLPFTFRTALTSGDSFDVTVGTQPLSEICTVARGTGTLSGNGNVTDIAVTCRAGNTIGGSVGGLAAPGLTLLDNGGDALRVERDSSFTFTQVLATGASYNVTVGTPPIGQLCTVANGSGTVAGDVNNILVTCTHGITIGGTVTGLEAGQTLVLLDNGGDALTIQNFLHENAFPFTFRMALASGDSFDVTVGTQPVSEICTVSSGTGTLSGNGNVTDIAVTCR